MHVLEIQGICGDLTGIRYVASPPATVVVFAPRRDDDRFLSRASANWVSKRNRHGQQRSAR